MYFISTDDNRISFIVIPISDPVNSMVETVSRSLATTQEKETNPDAELLLPLFKVAHYQADAYVGHQVSVTDAEGAFVSKYVATSA